ncbi:ABC transporter permease [Chromatiales bacterium (ex Bugula neritina AB1)]|nr:ABC transporter permease [Chromatiales bacterium (ex Bugula neritina AB1)]
MTTVTAETIDDTLLKKRLDKAMFRSRLRAFLLVSPLLLFLLITFIAPIGYFLILGFYDNTFSKIMPGTTQALKNWDSNSEPTEEMFAVLVADMVVARKEKTIGKVATRVNREKPGTRSLFTSSARKAARLEPPFRESLPKVKKAWNDIAVWQAMKTASRTFTPGYYAAALDLKLNSDGSITRQDEKRRIHMTLLLRTLQISSLVTLFCLALGYPIAYLLATLPARTSNLLLILVLLPFWTSILVRTTAWIAMLQSQGVVNDLLVFFGVTDDGSRYSLIYNKLGTLIAMTHILLPFMVLPLYSVMKGIPPSYVRAAKSLGANNWTAFWRVYAPQTIPGIGAGAILVFIVAIGYYITPALVGGQDGTMISNTIDDHMRKSLNWSLASALGGVLMVVVLTLYWLYDRVVGIDNMKLG